MPSLACTPPPRSSTSAAEDLTARVHTEPLWVLVVQPCPAQRRLAARVPDQPVVCQRGVVDLGPSAVSGCADAYHDAAALTAVLTIQPLIRSPSGIARVEAPGTSNLEQLLAGAVDL